jgi:hypothetical protein
LDGRFADRPAAGDRSLCGPRFLEPTADMPAPDGIIVLGGAINDLLSRARGQTVLDEGHRVVQAAILAKRTLGPGRGLQW